MKRYDNIEIKRSTSGKETLPAGGYVCQILSARVEDNDWGSTLVIAHDICEGDFNGFFRHDFDSNPNTETRKWRGTFRLKLPNDDGSEQDAWKKRSLGNTIWALEQSNPGFSFDWDEKKLKGKKIGLIYRNKEWAYNGKSGWTTEAGAAESVDNIRNGKFKPMKDRPLLNREPVDGPSDNVTENDLPF